MATTDVIARSVQYSQLFAPTLLSPFFGREVSDELRGCTT